MKKTKIIPLFFLILVWVLFFWKFLFKGLLPIPADITVGMYYPWLDYKWGTTTGVPVKNPLVSDIPSIIYPWRRAVIDSFKKGKWPLWNPSYFLGMPLLANFQSAVFSLANVFFVFLREPLAWGWGVASQSLLLMLTMFFYLKNKKLKIISCLLGAIVFSFSGFAAVWNQYNVHGWTMLFLPLILLLTDKYFKTSKKHWLLFLSLATAFQIFSGYIPVVVYSWLIVGALLIFEKKVFISKKQTCFIKKRFFPWLFFVVLGFGLAAIQIIPGLELISNSIRKIDPTVSQSNAGHLPVKHLITIAFPNFFGNPATGNYWGDAFYDNFSFWVGPIPLLLSLLALFAFKKRKEIIFWFLLVCFGFVLAIKNPLGIFLEKLLFLEGGVSARALFLVDFGLVILSSFGLNFLIESFSKIRKKCLGAILVTASLLAGLSYFIISPETNLFINSGVGRGELNVAMRNSLIYWASLSLFTFLFFFTSFKKKFAKLFSLAVLLLVVFNLWYPAQKYWSFTREELIFPETPVIEFLTKQEKPFRIEPGNVIPQNMWMPYGLETASGYDTLLPKRQGEFLSLVKTGSVSEKISRVHLLDNYNSNLFPLLNVKYILAKKVNEKGIFSPEGKPPPMFTDSRYDLVFEDKTVQVYQDAVYQPRIWSVNNVLTKIKDEDIVEAMSLPNFNPKETAVIGGTPLLDSFDDLGEAKIKFLNYSPLDEEMEILADQAVFLVESASFYPGWQAFLNGTEIDIIETNYGLRGYFIPQGKHLLKVAFNPKSFKWGSKITIVSFLFWSGILFSLAGKKLKRSHEA